MNFLLAIAQLVVVSLDDSVTDTRVNAAKLASEVLVPYLQVRMSVRMRVRMSASVSVSECEDGCEGG